MNYQTQRLRYFFGLLWIIALLAFAWYLQKYDGVDPCPLCVLQRIDLVILGIVFFFAAVLPLKKIGQVLFSLFAIFVSLGGLFLSGRQVWLQHLPVNEEAGCGVSLNYLIQVLPPTEVIKKIFSGTAECSKLGWQFLHLSLAEWSFIWFGIFTLFSLTQLIRALKK